MPDPNLYRGTLGGQAIEAIIHAARNGALCPVVGAGISVALGAPTWGDLLYQLLDNSPRFRFTPHQLTKITKEAEEAASLLEEDFAATVQRIQKILYPLDSDWAHDCKYEDYDIMHIARLCIQLAKVAPGKQFHAITYNYDVYLEEAIASFGHIAVALSHTGKRCWWPGSKSRRIANPVEIRIAHPHGVAPRPCPAHIKSNSIPQHHVCAAEEIVINPYQYVQRLLGAKGDGLIFDWQMTAFRSNLCFFNGISFKDTGVNELLRFAVDSDRKRRDRFPDHRETTSYQPLGDLHHLALMGWKDIERELPHSMRTQRMRVAAQKWSTLLLGGHNHQWKNRFLKVAVDAISQ